MWRLQQQERKVELAAQAIEPVSET
jgi:hypothetical protein